MAGRPARRGVHARRRQALHRQLHAAEGFGEGPNGRPASRTPSSRTCCSRRTIFSSCAGATTCGCRWAAAISGGTSPRGSSSFAARSAPTRTRSRRRSSRRRRERSSGRREAGAVWLDATLTSPYKFYQFLVNVDDRDAGRYLRYFTLLDREEIEALEQRHRRASRDARGAAGAGARSDAPRPRRRGARAPRRKSRAAVRRRRSEERCRATRLVALQLEIPVFTLEPKDELTTYDVLEAACVGRRRLFKSKGDMRRMLQQGGVYLNGRRLGPEREPLPTSDLLGGEFVLLRKGARSYALVKARWTVTEDDRPRSLARACMQGSVARSQSGSLAPRAL